MKWTNKGHEYDDIGYALRDKKHIYIYGLAYEAQEIITIIENSRQWIDWEVHLIDKNCHKQMFGFMGYAVMSPESFFESEKEDYFVIVAAGANVKDEIYDKVIENGVPKVLVYKYNYFLYNYLSVYFAYVHNIAFFTSINILPTTVCNLNCRDCLNFNPYIKKHKTKTLDEFIKEIDIFFNAVDFIYRFQITGGEPLLYNHLKEIVEYISDKYHNRIIRLEMVTNSTNIPSDELCQVLRDKNVYVFLDNYTMAYDNGYKRYKQVYDKIKRYHISFVENNVEEWIRMYTPDDTSSLCAKEELVDRFSVCGNVWSTLNDGKISACNYALYADTAEICKSDDRDYYCLVEHSKDRLKELIEFRTGYNERGYVEFCKKCNGWTSISQNWCKPAIQEKRKVGEDAKQI